MRQKQTIHFIQLIKQGHTIELSQKCSNYYIYMVDYYYWWGGLLEIFFGCRLHDIYSSFINIVIIAIIWIRVSVVDDDDYVDEAGADIVESTTEEYF